MTSFVEASASQLLKEKSDLPRREELMEEVKVYVKEVDSRSLGSTLYTRYSSAIPSIQILLYLYTQTTLCLAQLDNWNTHCDFDGAKRK